MGLFHFTHQRAVLYDGFVPPDIEIHSGHSTEGQQSLVQSRLNGQFLKINKQQHILHSIQHVQPLSFLHCWSDGVQLSASYVTIRRIRHIGLLQTVLNSSLRQSCSLEVSLNDMHYINSRFTYMLTLLKICYVFAYQSDSGNRHCELILLLFIKTDPQWLLKFAL